MVDTTPWRPAFTEEAVIPFPTDEEEDDDEYNNDELGLKSALKTATYEENAARETSGVSSGDNNANRPVEAVLTAMKTPRQIKKKSFLKRALLRKKWSPMKKQQQQDVDHVVIDQEQQVSWVKKLQELEEDPNDVIVPVVYIAIEDDQNDARKEEKANVPEEDKVIEDQGEVGGTVEDEDDNQTSIDLNTTQESFFKRALGTTGNLLLRLLTYIRRYLYRYFT